MATLRVSPARRRLPAAAVAAAALLLAATACDQKDQTLPLQTTGGVVTRTIGPAGGAVGSAAGAAVTFPAGALPAGTQVSIRPQTGASLGTPVDGRILPGTVFAIEPGGTLLGLPARLELRTDAAALPEREALALAPVVSAGGTTHYLNDANVDLTSGMVRGPSSRLGTVALRVAADVQIPRHESSFQHRGGPIFPVEGSLSAAFGAASAVTYSVACGTSVVPRVSCSSGASPIAATFVNDALHERHGNAMAFLPDSIAGALVLSSADRTIAGAVTAWGVLRTRIGATITSTVEELTITAAGPDGRPQPLDVDVKHGLLRFGQHVLGYTVDGNALVLSLPETRLRLKRTVLGPGGTSTTVEDEGTLTAVVRLTRSP
jgi:hypothetical protein